MVGIARARGCGTCRKRKIACGLEKPSCAQCIKSKRVCTGYPRYPIFIHHKANAELQTDLVARHNEADLSAKVKSASPEEQAELSRLMQLPRDNTDSLYTVRTLVSLVGQVSPLPSLRQQLLEEYLALHLPRARLGPMQQRLWLFQLPTMPHLSTALEVSAMAMCVAKLGEVYDDSSLRYEGLRLYHQGLHQLQKALWDPELMYHEHTLAACIALATYEMSQCPNESKQGYISHTSGCEKLIQLRGPEAHTDGFAHQIFVQCRVQGILYALDSQRPTFLSQPEWQQVPWQNNPKTLFDQIYDFVLVAPELQRQGKLLEHLDPRSQFDLAMEMIAKCWKTDRDLDSLYDRLVSSQTGPLYWSELACGYITDEDTEDGMLFPVAFHFPNLSVATNVLIFWACQAMLWQGMCQLYRHMEVLRDRFTQGGNDMTSDMHLEGNTGLFGLPALDHRTDFAAPARNIFQSMEYCLMDDMKDHGPKVVAAPLRIAIETLRAYPMYQRDVQWAEEVMAKVQGRSLRLLRYYTGVNNPGEPRGREFASGSDP